MPLTLNKLLHSTLSAQARRQCNLLLQWYVGMCTALIENTKAITTAACVTTQKDILLAHVKLAGITKSFQYDAFDTSLNQIPIRHARVTAWHYG